MFERENWIGSKLIEKIRLWTLLGIYFLVFPMMSLLQAPPGQPIPKENLTLFTYLVAGIVFFVLLELYITKSVMLTKAQEYGGKRLWKGRIDLGGGRTENFRWLIKGMFTWEEATENIKRQVEISEERLKEYEENIFPVEEIKYEKA